MVIYRKKIHMFILSHGMEMPVSRIRHARAVRDAILERRPALSSPSPTEGDAEGNAAKTAHVENGRDLIMRLVLRMQAEEPPARLAVLQAWIRSGTPRKSRS
jgi:hypothetical protein